MSEFVLTGQDLYGRYARIAYGYKAYASVPGKQDYHIYKVIQHFQSNCYCDVPLTYQTENNCYNHGEVVDVVYVIHCGIDESRVIRVALKDIELLPTRSVPWTWLKDFAEGKRMNYASEFVLEAQEAYNNGTD